MFFANFTCLHAIYLTLAFSGVSRAASISSTSRLQDFHEGAVEPSFWERLIQDDQCPSVEDVVKHGIGKSIERRSLLVLSTRSKYGREAQFFGQSQGLVYVPADDVFLNFRREFNKKLEKICSKLGRDKFWEVVFEALLWAVEARHLYIYNPSDGEVSAAVRRFQQNPGVRPGRTSIYSVTFDKNNGYHISLQLEDPSTWSNFVKRDKCPPPSEFADISAIGDEQMKSAVLTVADDAAEDYGFANKKGAPVITIRDAFPGYPLVAKEMERICGENMRHRLLEAMAWSINADELFVYNDPAVDRGAVETMVVASFRCLGDKLPIADQVADPDSGRTYAHVRYHQ